MSDLAQALERVRIQDGPAEGWKVQDRSSAQWAMKKIWELRQQQKGIQEEAAQVREPLQIQMDLINAWEKQETAKLDDSAAFFEGELIRWLTEERAKNPDLKSVKLPYGTVASRRTPDRIEIDDETALINFLSVEAEDELLKVETKLNKAALKERVLKDGQIIPHVKRVEGELTYQVKVAEVAE